MAQHITTLNEIRERTVSEGFTPDIAVRTFKFGY